FEHATDEQETRQIAKKHLPTRHLGDPVNYASYVVARLTRTDPGEVANFNLDADRGYGYLCWDWVRTDQITGVPPAYRRQRGNPEKSHVYDAPIRPGFGWCDEDLLPPSSPPDPDHVPVMDDPTNPQRKDVRIRYIGQELKIQ